MQLRKSVNLSGLNQVEFRNGEKKSIHPLDAHKMLCIHDSYEKPGDKENINRIISFSIEGFERVLALEDLSPENILKISEEYRACRLSDELLDRKLSMTG